MDESDDDIRSIVRTLTSRPSEDQLVLALRRFEPSSSSPTPSSASVTFAIVNTTIPELWRSLRLDKTTSKTIIPLLVDCLSSITGVNALLMRLNQIYTQIKHQPSNNDKCQLEDALEILTVILESEKFSPENAIATYTRNDGKSKLLFNEYMSLVGGSKILNVSSKVALDLHIEGDFWISDGKRYSKWLGEKIAMGVKSLTGVVEITTLLERALNIGFPCNFNLLQI